MKRASAEASAFNGRQAAFLLNAEANWDDPSDDAANISWARDFIAAMEPFSDGSRYLNFPGFQEEGDAMMRVRATATPGQPRAAGCGGPARRHTRR